MNPFQAATMSITTTALLNLDLGAREDEVHRQIYMHRTVVFTFQYVFLSYNIVGSAHGPSC